jgi:nicotinamide-nucleotide amidase
MAALAADLDGLAASVLATCGGRGLTLATAESCTGGMIAAALTAIAGSSAVFERGYVVYSNLAKQQMLGVPEETLARHGAVSAQTAIAMAEAALARSGAAIAVAVTGIAGPGGGTDQKPVGLVHLACARVGRQTSDCAEVFAGDRGAVRDAAARRALEMVLDQASAV